MRLAVLLLGVCFVTGSALGGCGGSEKEVRSSSSSKSKSKSKSKKSKKRKKSSSAQPNDADANYQNAIDAQADGDRKAASKYYQLAIRKDPTHRRANQRYVHFLIDNNRTSKALKVAQRFFDNVPGKAISYHTLADAAAANGDHKRVVGTMSGLLAFEEEDASAYEIRGRARLKIGDNEEGLDDIRRAVKMEPDNSDFLLSLAGGLMRVSQRDEARQTLVRVLRSDKGNARAHLLLGLLARIEGKNAESLKQLKQAVANDADDARAHFELGITQNLLGSDSEAEESFGRAVELEPDNGSYWYTYGDLLRLMQRMEEAAAAYRASVKRKPDSPKAWERLAEALIATGQLQDAAKQLRRGIGKVQHPKLYFVLAKVYKQLNKKERAIEALENYLNKAEGDAPDRRAATKLLKRLKR